VYKFLHLNPFNVSYSFRLRQYQQATRHNLQNARNLIRLYCTMLRMTTGRKLEVIH